MKKLSVILATLAMTMSLVACGGGEEKVTEIDTAALAQRLVSEVTYTEELNEDDVENYFFTLEEGVTGIAYMSAGFSGEEVVVFTAPDEETAVSTKETVEAFLTEQSTTMAPYAPDAVGRIENAVLVQEGKYVILCVSEDSEKAEEIIKEAFGE